MIANAPQRASSVFQERFAFAAANCRRLDESLLLKVFKALAEENAWSFFLDEERAALLAERVNLRKEATAIAFANLMQTDSDFVTRQHYRMLEREFDADEAAELVGFVRELTRIDSQEVALQTA